MAKEKQENELETGINADASVDVAVEQKEKIRFLRLLKHYAHPILLRNLRMNN